MSEGQAEPDRRELVLQMLRDSTEPRSISSMATEMGMHPNTIRFHLETLMDAGRVEQTPGASTGRGRPPILYRTIRQMDPNGPTNYRLLAQMLATHLVTTSANPAKAAVELGRSWGASEVENDPQPATADGVEVLTNILDGLGFSPESASPAAEIRLRHCPFHQMVKSHGPVICNLHLGLMQGVLGSLADPTTIGRLEPFAEPDMCVAHLEPGPKQR